MTDMAVTLTACNLIGLALAVLLAWASRHECATPEGRARILSAVTVAAFAFTAAQGSSVLAGSASGPRGTGRSARTSSATAARSAASYASRAKRRLISAMW